jgi:hypothetical protein
MADSATLATPRASVFEDFIDIFYAPSSVFARRRDASPWPAILIVSGLFIIASYISFSLLAPVMDAEMQRQLALAAAKGQSVPPEQLATMEKVGRWGMLGSLVMFAPMTILVLGIVAWVVGKVLGAEQPLRASFLVVALSLMPRVLETLLSALQSFFLDVTTLPSIYAASLTPARFLGPDASEGMLALLLRFGPFLLWSYALIAIGLAVTGRISGQKAAIGAAVIWLLGTLAQVAPAMLRG